MHNMIENPPATATTPELPNTPEPLPPEQAVVVTAEPRRKKPDFDELNERLLDMPREVGLLMVSIGVIGVALPGIVGTPALLAGGLMLWPRGFRAVNSWVRKRFPKTHEHGVEQLIRYLDDMERRYPSEPER
jgi:hypothetical protein